MNVVISGHQAMHSAVSLSSDQEYFWAFGGRGSPSQPSQTILKFSVKNMSVIEEVQLKNVANRYLAICVFLNTISNESMLVLVLSQ